MKKLFFTLLISVSAFTFAQTKREKIQNLLALTGSANMGVQVAAQMVDSFKMSYKNVPDEYWVKLKQEMRPEDLANLIIPIYDKHFTEAEIDAIAAFYQSPTGQKMLSKMPDIIAESQQAGMAWGQKIAEKVMADMEKYNYKSPPPPDK